ncbi:lytic transglycosylase domain-containing protein [Bacteroidota bacterium]
MKNQFSLRIRIKWIISLILLVVVVVILAFRSSDAGKETNNSIGFINSDIADIHPVVIPDTLYFAGELVPLHYFDVREALDRELLSNTYFHSQTIRLIKLANRYFQQIEPILERHGIPDDFKYLAVAESGLANAVSPAGAVGFWQIRKGTGQDYGLEISTEVDERYHLEKATEVACEYIKESYEKYNTWTMAAASYNAGRRGVDRQVARQKQTDYYELLLNEETARYIFRILAFKLIVENPSDYGFQIKESDLYKPLLFKTVIVDSTVENFADFAALQNTNYKMLKLFNPWLRDTSLTNKSGKSYEIRIPTQR